MCHQHSPQQSQGQPSEKQLQTHVRTQKYEFNMQYGKTGSSEQKFITEKPVPPKFRIFVSNLTML
jgi:hypothetical protein